MDDGRDLDWDGMYNVRDLGGLPTRSGGRTRRGAFVRSEGLDLLTTGGWASLRRHGVRTCVDLRSEWEVDQRPYRSPSEATSIIAAPWEEGLLDDPVFAAWAETGVLSCALYFQPFLERWPERSAAMIATLADAVRSGGDAGVLYHCQRGRERTGLLTILLLALAEVPSAVIVEDHLRTDGRLLSHGIALGHVSLDGEADRYAERATTAEATVSALLDALDVEDYLLAAGVTDTDLATIRAHLVTS